MSKIKRLFHIEEGIRISSSFGYRTSPINGKQEFHRGVDYATGGRKLPQYGLDNGIVIKAGKDTTGALFVEVEYPNLGYIGQYYHLDSISVSKGQKVDENTIIGYTGTTGYSTGIHLHFGWYPIADKNISYYSRRWSNFEDFRFNDEVVNVEKVISRIDLNNKEWEYMFSLDGNRFGEKYDKTTMKYFSDKGLEENGWQKYITVNASIFYPYTNKDTGKEEHFAEGLEKSRGVNNQPLDMDAVKKFNDTMSVGMTYDGRLIFDKQSKIIENLDSYYGAFTGMFGIMKDGLECRWGVELEHKRNYMYSGISGRTVIGYSSVANEVIVLSIPGETGKTGVRGEELFQLCREAGMTDAMCCDCGGSVFLIKDGEVIIPSTRAVKNAFLVYRRKRKTTEQNPTTEIPQTQNNSELKALKAELKTLKEEHTKLLNQNLLLIEENTKLMIENDKLKTVLKKVQDFLKELGG